MGLDPGGKLRPDSDAGSFRKMKKRGRPRTLRLGFSCVCSYAWETNVRFFLSAGWLFRYQQARTQQDRSSRGFLEISIRGMINILPRADTRVCDGRNYKFPFVKQKLMDRCIYAGEKRLESVRTFMERDKFACDVTLGMSQPNNHRPTNTTALEHVH